MTIPVPSWRKLAQTVEQAAGLHLRQSVITRIRERHGTKQSAVMIQLAVDCLHLTVAAWQCSKCQHVGSVDQMLVHTCGAPIVPLFRSDAADWQ